MKLWLFMSVLFFGIYSPLNTHAQSMATFCYKMAYTNEIQECLDNRVAVEDIK